MAKGSGRYRSRCWKGRIQVPLQRAMAEGAQAVGAELLLSDDADPYKTVADELGLEQ